LVLDQTGRISGIPAAVGSYNVTVFVSDNLATVSRSFVWTITSLAGADTTVPALSITSHSAGQIVSSSNATVSGTAPDNGRGGTGITSATVNGQSAGGGTASCNGTANWSRSVTLVSGTNTILVEARDGAGNTTLQQFALSYGEATLSVTAGVVTPSAGTGSQQTFSAPFSATAGVGNLAYVYLKFDVSPWGPANTCMVRYEYASHTLSLRDDAGVWQPERRFSEGGSQENSQCGVAFATSSVTAKRGHADPQRRDDVRDGVRRCEEHLFLRSDDWRRDDQLAAAWVVERSAAHDDIFVK
jgi:hypothetical protein